MTIEEKLARIKDFRPIDDVFFEALAQNREFCQEILRVIMDDKSLTVEDVIIQSDKRNLYGRSVRLDALCILGNGAEVNIEVQRSDNDNHLKRVRFNAASITVKDSDTGSSFDDLLELYIVYISEFDFLKGGRTIYHVDKVIRENGETIDDGLHEIFVNTAVNDGTDIAELMSCFLQKMVDNSKFPVFSSEVKRLKETEGGATSMCEIMERYTKEAALEGLKKGKEQGLKQGLKQGRILAVQNMIEMGIPKDKILSKYSEEEYEEAASDKTV